MLCVVFAVAQPSLNFDLIIFINNKQTVQCAGCIKAIVLDPQADTVAICFKCTTTRIEVVRGTDEGSGMKVQ